MAFETEPMTAESSVAAKSAGKPRLAFISPLFLFPNDAGGKIRTTNILRGMKGSAFHITLISPASRVQRERFKAEIEGICDEFVSWKPTAPPPQWKRVPGLLDALPINVLADRTLPAVDVVRQTLGRSRFDLAVFDFVHAAVLKPEPLNAKTLCFTHNVESEIFARHATQASNLPMRMVWKSQHRKMERFEGDALRGFTSVVAVSERDARFFREHYGVTKTEVIPTGVDLDFFAWRERVRTADRPPTVVFTGVMDWMANAEGVHWFLDDVWPRVVAQVNDARFVIVGRNPSPALIDATRKMPEVNVTGFVDDVRPYTYDADACVIPLRVGGGTRIKAFEAMAMGCPVVSTTIGVEGLDVVDGEHYLLADEAPAIADAIVRLLRDAKLADHLSRSARLLVETKFGHAVAARAFEAACLRAL